MWGRHVEYQIHQSLKNAKTESARKSKASYEINRLLHPLEEVKEGEVPPKGMFKDPAKRFASKG